MNPLISTIWGLILTHIKKANKAITNLGPQTFPEKVNITWMKEKLGLSFSITNNSFLNFIENVQFICDFYGFVHFANTTKEQK